MTKFVAPTYTALVLKFAAEGAGWNEPTVNPVTVEYRTHEQSGLYGLQTMPCTGIAYTNDDEGFTMFMHAEGSARPAGSISYEVLDEDDNIIEVEYNPDGNIVRIKG